MPKTLAYVGPHIVRNVRCFAFAWLMPSRSSKSLRLLSTSTIRSANSVNSEIVFTTQRPRSVNKKFTKLGLTKLGLTKLGLTKLVI